MLLNEKEAKPRPGSCWSARAAAKRWAGAPAALSRIMRWLCRLAISPFLPTSARVSRVPLWTKAVGEISRKQQTICERLSSSSCSAQGPQGQCNRFPAQITNQGEPRRCFVPRHPSAFSPPDFATASQRAGARRVETTLDKTLAELR